MQRVEVVLGGVMAQIGRSIQGLAKCEVLIAVNVSLAAVWVSDSWCQCVIL